MQEVRIRRLATGSIFKLIFFGSWMGSIPVFFFLGILAFSGVQVLSWNGEYISGWSALIAGPLLGLFLATLFGGFVGCLTALGYWMLSKRQGIRLFCEFEDAQTEAAGDA